MRNLLDIDINSFKQCKDKICIISVIRKEMKAIVDRYKLEVKEEEKEIKWTGEVSINNTEYTIDCYQLPDVGNINSAMFITNILNKEYKYFFLVGTAGSRDLQLYSVMLVNRVVFNDNGEHVDGETNPDTDIRSVEDDINIKYKAFETKFDFMDEKDFEMKVGTIYSSNYVEKDPNNEGYLNAHKAVRSIKAIEMESYGAMRAEEYYNAMNKSIDKHVVMLRGVSDKADNDKNAIYEDGLKPDARKEKATNNTLIVLEEYIKFLESM